MTTDAPSFNLITQPWLPVQYRDGTEKELSLLEVFKQAPLLRRLVGDVPTQEFALLRLLLAILHDAIGGPEDSDEWAELWTQDEAEQQLPFDCIASYLEQYYHRFDLLHPTTPFFQVADLHTQKNDVFSLDRIVADVPNGELFFTMRARGVDRLSFAEAARWLVHAHAYDTSGIKSGAVGDPRAKGGKGYPQGVSWAGNLGGILVEGANLYETLLLNLVAFDTDNLIVTPEDRPAWRQPPTTAAPADDEELAQRPYGLCDLYTWQSRRIRLHYDADGVYGVLLAYGDPLAPHNKHNHEPMTAWRRSPAQEKKLKKPQVYLPREHDPTRSAWRGLGALVAGEASGAEQRGEAAAIVRPRILDWVARLVNEGFLPEDYFIRTRLIGVSYGTQQAVIDEIVDDHVAMAVVLLHERDSGLGRTAIKAVEDAEKAVTVLGGLAADLAKAAGADPETPRAAARDRGFGMLDGPFRTWLATLAPGTDATERRRAWQQKAHRIISDLGRQLVAEAGEAAWNGRVIKGKNTDVWLNASRADLKFRAELKKELPMATSEQTGEAAS
ncbi:CRISPR-associated protein, Cse1 family [Thermobifida fusca YX]|uniref:CRISPR-associated Cse1 family protein n=3 Tax=Thermobifida fusca TaxID=2021 RepID=A0A9P2TAC1_THEFU|nr:MULTISPECIES: type I-E CRISPR-associated protein Cse1/CasA [Thermobifida]AAZ55635.1 CRISPR-associated protein, Cse1 family [Thermobifida fusca YX]EOR71315.1 CRISPR-associated Cse1 family protein [Thermobifida fusca TM51]MBO2531180.1 type I-E CRISPR-associated protein Cse1/CasA [Thermobifida sp.]PPS91689.1 CRISPR-associated protein Cse1 [Thermobifida fusca]QOS58181.1 type I-E CRISPR-associated protein Cse1/CasA [Thermobifida fusca]